MDMMMCQAVVCTFAAYPRGGRGHLEDETGRLVRYKMKITVIVQFHSTSRQCQTSAADDGYDDVPGGRVYLCCIPPRGKRSFGRRNWAPGSIQDEDHSNRTVPQH